MKRAHRIFLAAVFILAGVIVAAGFFAAQTVSRGNTSPDGPVNTLIIPDVRQSESYSCGAACTQAVFNYWGVDVREGTLMQELNTTGDAGTAPDSIVNVARAHGLTAYRAENLTIDDLARAVDAKIPVIVDCQAWRDPNEVNESWESLWEDGHYMIVIGVDSANVYFEDPSLQGTRGYIPRDEFESRWHDYPGESPYGKNSTAFYHLGIFINGTVPASYPPFTHVD
ncbi:MAG: C39 family peptidase [Methanoregula sp.]|nr:C39 family peptidase [Methanoregula sp.]